MKKPPHPGRSIKDACLDPMDLTIQQAAHILDIPKDRLSYIINGKIGITKVLAYNLSNHFGGTAEGWYNMQVAYDTSRSKLNKYTKAELIDIIRCRDNELYYIHDLYNIFMIKCIIYKRRKIMDYNRFTREQLMGLIEDQKADIDRLRDHLEIEQTRVSLIESELDEACSKIIDKCELSDMFDDLTIALEKIEYELFEKGEDNGE